MKERDDILFDLERIQDALDANNTDGLKFILEDCHPSEIAQFLDALPPKARERIINILPIEIASEAIAEMDPESHPETLLGNLHPELAGDIVEELSDDDAVDLLNELPADKREKILDEMDAEDASDIRKLMTYPEDSAGGLMTTELITVHYSATKKQALDAVIEQSEEMGEFYSIYVTDDADRLTGTLSLKTLIKAKPSALIQDIMDEDVIYVEANTDQEEVVKLLSQYNLAGIPVVDENRLLIGRITFDDAMDVLQEESTEDILKLSGVSDDEELSGNWKEAVKSRLPWLILNLGTAFLAASIIRHFNDILEHLLVLTAYMTMIAGMGGNAATQALAVTIRRISLNDISDKQAYQTILKEFLVGLTNGAVNGSIVFLAAIIFDGNPLLGLVIFLAMTGNMIIAGIAGSSIPLFLKRVGVDPAVASSIIITTFTDVFGFLLLLGLASNLLL